MLETITTIKNYKDPKRVAAAFRNAGSTATLRQLAAIKLSARALYEDIEGLNEPAVLALAAHGFSNRHDLLRLARAVSKSAIRAEMQVIQDVKEGHIVEPIKGRKPDLLALGIARMVAHHFKAITGSEPNADGRESQFVDMLEAVLIAAEIEGNARHYATQAVAGRKSGEP